MIQMTTLPRFICIVFYVPIFTEIENKGNIGFLSHISCIFVACIIESEFAEMYTAVCYTDLHMSEEQCYRMRVT